jgi:hypothetical protein
VEDAGEVGYACKWDVLMGFWKKLGRRLTD